MGILRIVQIILYSFRLEIWQIRMREIQGAICVASLFQVLLGFTGVIGVLLRWAKISILEMEIMMQ